MLDGRFPRSLAFAMPSCTIASIAWAPNMAIGWKPTPSSRDA
jgi:hypothetical protein